MSRNNKEKQLIPALHEYESGNVQVPEMHPLQRRVGIRSEHAQTAEGEGFTFPFGTTWEGKKNQNRKTRLTQFFSNSYRERTAKTGS